MDLIFAMHRKQLKCSPPSLGSINGGPTLCTVSVGNIIAFTSLTELTDISGTTWGCHTYVCDINSPWNSYKVASFKNQVSALEWDSVGKYLLIADCMGGINIYAPRDYLLNDWSCLYQANLPGEHIIKAAFFHNGRKVIISSDKKIDQLPCTEKFQQVRFLPSVRHFGHTAAEGCLVITSTGLIAAMLIPAETTQNQHMPSTAVQTPQQLKLAVEPLLTSRDHIVNADICYGKSGHFLIAVSSGNAVRCFRASVVRWVNSNNANNPPVLSCQPLPSFFPKEIAIRDGQGVGSNWTVVCVRWIAKEDADSLAVSLSAVQNPSSVGTAEGDSIVQLWGLIEKSLPIHSLLLNKGNNGSVTPSKQTTECFNTVTWQYQCHYRMASSRLSWLCVSRCVHTTSQQLLLATTNNQLYCLQADTLKLAYSTSVSPSWTNGLSGGGPGAAIANCSVSCVDVTSLSVGLVVVDSSSNLYLFKLPQPASDPNSPLAVVHATTLLEYSIVSGCDTLDLMLMLKPNILEAVYERLTESFLRQPSSWQQYHNLRWLSVKAALSRLSPVGQSRSSELTCLLMLHSIYAAFKSLLRPAELTSMDKGPAENLAAVVSEQANPPLDIDKALMHIEAKEFAAEPVALQSARRLIQWIAELALASLAALPNIPSTTGASNRNMYHIARDPTAVSALRELLVVARVWGLQRPHCLPAFARAPDGADVLAQLYRMLTRLAHHRCEPDDSLKDDCSGLPSQVLIPRMWESLPRTGVASPQPHHLPLHLEYGVEPENLKYVPEVPQLEGSITSDCCMDSIRHMYLGLRPGAVKRCGRCGAAAAPAAPPRTAAQRSWDQRWLQHCRCGGRWNLEVNT